MVGGQGRPRADLPAPCRWTPGSPVQKTRGLWLESATALYGAKGDITVWVTSLGGHVAEFPEEGHVITMDGGGMNSQRYKLAHELGHYLGLGHTWTPVRYDPIWQQAAKLSDTWDLVYKPGTSSLSPHTFYNSRAEAAADESYLEIIEKRPCPVHCTNPDATCRCQAAPCSGACIGDPDCGACVAGGECDSCIDGGAGVLTCHIGEDPSYWEQASNGDAKVKGLAFLFAGGAQGPNVLSYRGDWNTHPYGISDSQIEMIRKYLRWDVTLDATRTSDIQAGFNYSFPALSGRRPRLGHYNLHEPTQQLDFDGDGRRDVGIWEPPLAVTGTGAFTVLLSSKSFSTASGDYLYVQLGQVGDVPVPADYSGDGRADVAVFQPGSATDAVGWWRWCPTANPAESTPVSCTPSSFAYGVRGDTPQPGLEFNGAAGDELSVYRPNAGTWHFRSLIGPSVHTNRSIGTAGAGVVPYAGLYDCDGLTDLAVYDPSAAKFLLLRSEQSWNTLLTRWFNYDFVPQPSGQSYERAGAMPLASFTGLRLCWVGGGFFQPRKRRSFALFFHYDATWNVLWNPIGSSTVQSCQYGDNVLDQPIAGLDRNGDFYSDMAVFRSGSYTDPGTIYTRLSVVGGCNGQSHNVYCSWCPRTRRRVFAVPDMTGDGKDEIMMVMPDEMNIFWFSSESDYTLATQRQLGSTYAIVL